MKRIRFFFLLCLYVLCVEIIFLNLFFSESQCLCASVLSLLRPEDFDNPLPAWARMAERLN